MADYPLVSVLITSYNREKYIAEAIDSVLQQTYPEIEIIITDNRSTDKTMQVLEKYKSNPAIRIFQNESNLGQFPNRNLAASYAKGKYLKYVDSDDILYPHAIAIMVEALEQYPEAGFGVFSNLPQDEKPYPLFLGSAQAFEQYFGKSDVLGMGPIGTIFRTEAFRSVEGYTNYSIAGDTELLMRMALRYPVVKIGTCQFWWRRHPGQEYSNPTALKSYVIHNYLIHNEIISHKSFPLDKVKSEQLLKTYNRLLGKNLLKYFIFKGDWKNAREIMTQTKFKWGTYLQSYFH